LENASHTREVPKNQTGMYGKGQADSLVIEEEVNELESTASDKLIASESLF